MSDRTHQKICVLTYLGNFGQIDPWTCARKFGWLKLSTIVSELRSDGHQIKDAWRKTKCGTRYKIYFLVKANRKAA